MKKWILFIFFFMLSSLVYASTPNILLRPAIQLDDIVSIKTIGKSVDNIYVSISEFNSKGRNRYYTVPQSPVYWPGKSIHEINNFQLWQGKLPVMAATEVVISLIEEDTPPWHLDDLISVIKIKMVNQDGQIQYEWYQDGKLIAKQKNTVAIQFKGSNEVYKAHFSLILRDSARAKAKVHGGKGMEKK